MAGILTGACHSQETYDIIYEKLFKKTQVEKVPQTYKYKRIPPNTIWAYCTTSKRYD